MVSLKKVKMTEYCDLIVPGLFLGSVLSFDTELDFLIDAYGLTTVVRVLSPEEDLMLSAAQETCRAKFIALNLIQIEDDADVDLSPHLPDFVKVITESSGPVLVHCRAGVSRSASLVVGYLMWKDKISLDKALTQVKKERPRVAPNVGFLRALVAWQNIVCGEDDPFDVDLQEKWAARFPKATNAEMRKVWEESGGDTQGFCKKMCAKK